MSLFIGNLWKLIKCTGLSIFTVIISSSHASRTSSFLANCNVTMDFSCFLYEPYNTRDVLVTSKTLKTTTRRYSRKRHRCWSIEISANKKKNINVNLTLQEFKKPQWFHHINQQPQIHLSSKFYKMISCLLIVHLLPVQPYFCRAKAKFLYIKFTLIWILMGGFCHSL